MHAYACVHDNLIENMDFHTNIMSPRRHFSFISQATRSRDSQHTRDSTHYCPSYSREMKNTEFLEVWQSMCKLLDALRSERFVIAFDFSRQIDGLQHTVIKKGKSMKTSIWAMKA